MSAEFVPVWVQFKDTSEPLFPFRPGEMREARRNGSVYHIDTEMGTYTVVANQVEEITDPTTPAPSLPTQASDDDGRETGPLDPSKALSFEGYKAPITALDPTAVRAGDTVTLTGPAKRAWVAGPVSSITYIGGGEWDIKIDGLSTYRVGRIGVWTLTAHQPAPEPEPEWEDGQIGDALVHGASVRGFISNNGESFVFSVPGGGYHEAGHGSFEDFVPLVVIDPATAYGVLTGFFEANRREPWESAEEYAIRALTPLGIEVQA